MITEIQTVPVVSVKDGAVYANSRDVADFFGKRHDNVLADIANIQNGLSPEILGQWFRPSTYPIRTGFGFRDGACFDMTKDGFTLLVMGYTGGKAMQFKLAYIQRFNEMEEVLKAAPTVPAFTLPDFTDPATAARAWADQYSRAQVAESVVNRIMAYPEMLGIQEAAKALKIAPKAFGQMLREWKWVYDRRGTKKSKLLAYQDAIDRGLMVHDAVELGDGSIKLHPKLTGKGIAEASKRLDAFE
jgi:Rha family phage regulatory protein